MMEYGIYCFIRKENVRTFSLHSGTRIPCLYFQLSRYLAYELSPDKIKSDVDSELVVCDSVTTKINVKKHYHSIVLSSRSNFKNCWLLLHAELLPILSPVGGKK